MIRAFCFAILVVTTAAATASAQWQSSCPGGVCRIRAFVPTPTITMTAAPAVRIPTAESPPPLLVSVEAAPAFPVFRAIADGQPIAAPVRRIATLPVRFVRWLRGAR